MKWLCGWFGMSLFEITIYHSHTENQESTKILNHVDFIGKTSRNVALEKTKNGRRNSVLPKKKKKRYIKVRVILK